MGTPQLSYSQFPVAGTPGMVATLETRDGVSVWINEPDGIEPGLCVVRDGIDGGKLPAGQAIDADAVIVTGESDTDPQLYTAEDFDGVIGSASILVPAPVTITFNSNAHWDATTAVLTAVNAEGVTVTEDIAIPNDGDATVTTEGSYTQVISLAIPAQGGTAGTFTLGFAASNALTSAQVLGPAAWDPSQEAPRTLRLHSRSTFWRRGIIWVQTETEVSPGQRAYARVFAPGAEQIGAWRADGDGGNALPIEGARFRRVASPTLAELEVSLAT